MTLTEKEIEDFIYDDLINNGGMELSERGFQIHYLKINDSLDQKIKVKWLRQVQLGPYGILDIVGYYKYAGQIYVDLIELKAVPIRVDDFEQISRYEHAISEYVQRIFKGYQFIVFKKYLIGNGFTDGHYLSNKLSVNVVEFTYDLTGIQFEQHTANWHRPDAKDFNVKKSLHNAEKIHGYR